MLRPRGVATSLACAVVFIAAALSITAAPASSDEVAVPSRDFSLANAAKVLPSGFDRVGNDFIYAGGDVVITPAAVAAQEQGCVAHYVCLYRNANYTGDRWMFQDEVWVNLRNWGASDVVSSWKNRQGSCDGSKLGWNSIEQGITPTLTLACTGEDPNMGNWNDEASSIHG